MEPIKQNIMENLLDRGVFGGSLLQYRIARKIYGASELLFLQGKENFSLKEIIDIVSEDFPQIKAPARNYAYGSSAMSVTGGRVMKKLQENDVIIRKGLTYSLHPDLVKAYRENSVYITVI